MTNNELVQESIKHWVRVVQLEIHCRDCHAQLDELEKRLPIKATK